MFFKKVIFLKLTPSLFPSISLLEPLMQLNLDANFLGHFVTSQVVLDYLEEVSSEALKSYGQKPWGSLKTPWPE